MTNAARRLDGIDVARGVACVCMFVAHGFDAYVRPEDRSSAAYAITRWFAKIPLPLFLLLAGVGVALRFAAADRRGEELGQVARGVLRRALIILLAGYALSAFMAWLDGYDGPQTLLRADVLHVIGLSIALTAMTLAAPPERRVGRALLVAAVLLLPSPWLNRLSPGGALAPLFGLFVEAGAFTVMPLFPLGAWCLLGAGLTVGWQRRDREASPDHAHDALLLAGVAAAFAWLAVRVTATHMAWAGGTLTRRHPAVYWNALELFFRALSALSLSIWCAPRVPRLARDWLRLLGRHSLLAYAFHLPFAYGSWGALFHRRLAFSQAALAVAGLTLWTTLAVWVRSRVGARLKRRNPAAARANNAP